MQPSYIDIQYQGLPQLIACGFLATEAGPVLVDPGPTVAIEDLGAGLERLGTSFADVQAILLTHIHLDHAGAVGTLVRRFPGIQVYVHAIGARHLVAPERLLRSAERLYGDQMDTLWGAFEAVPPENITALEGGERIKLGGRAFDVAYTPGHAVHHVSYLDEQTGMAFVGDTAGMRVTGCDYVLPVTPPPDVHLEQWVDSLDRIAAWRPTALFTTHFGPHDDVKGHLDNLRAGLATWATRVREALTNDGVDADCAASFAAAELRAIDRLVPSSFRQPYVHFGLPEASWYGMARYLRKHQRS